MSYLPSQPKRVVAVYWPRVLRLNVLDMGEKPRLEDVAEWVGSLGRRGRCSTAEHLAEAVGLVLGPVPSKAVKPTRSGRVLLYSSLAPATWLRAMLLRETARYALERWRVEATADALETISEAARSCVRDGARSSARAQSSSRLRLGIS